MFNCCYMPMDTLVLSALKDKHLLQHFFGGAMGVFTTQTLLNSVGVSKSRATSGAVAINWILKVSHFGAFVFSDWTQIQNLANFSSCSTS